MKDTPVLATLIVTVLVTLFLNLSFLNFVERTGYDHSYSAGREACENSYSNTDLRPEENYLYNDSIYVNEKQIHFPVFRRPPETPISGMIMALEEIDAVFIYSEDRWFPLVGARYHSHSGR